MFVTTVTFITFKGFWCKVLMYGKMTVFTIRSIFHGPTDPKRRIALLVLIKHITLLENNNHKNHSIYLFSRTRKRKILNIFCTREIFQSKVFLIIMVISYV